jgi:hypothetical protein
VRSRNSRGLLWGVVGEQNFYPVGQRLIGNRPDVVNEEAGDRTGCEVAIHIATWSRLPLCCRRAMSLLPSLEVGNSYDAAKRYLDNVVVVARLTAARGSMADTRDGRGQPLITSTKDLDFAPDSGSSKRSRYRPGGPSSTVAVNWPDWSVLVGSIGKLSHLPASRRCTCRKVSGPPGYVPRIRTIWKALPESGGFSNWMVAPAEPEPVLPAAPGVLLAVGAL